MKGKKKIANTCIVLTRTMLRISKVDYNFQRQLSNISCPTRFSYTTTLLFFLLSLCLLPLTLGGPNGQLQGKKKVTVCGCFIIEGTSFWVLEVPSVLTNYCHKDAAWAAPISGVCQRYSQGSVNWLGEVGLADVVPPPPLKAGVTLAVFFLWNCEGANHNLTCFQSSPWTMFTYVPGVQENLMAEPRVEGWETEWLF
jgi:hypothetical protein